MFFSEILSSGGAVGIRIKKPRWFLMHMTFIHPKAEVTEGVKLGKNCWVSAFAAINANEGEIKIGDNCSIQESCVIHGIGVSIGNNVTVGHGAIVHGAKIGNNVIVGMHATVLDNAEIGDWCIIGA